MDPIETQKRELAELRHSLRTTRVLAVAGFTSALALGGVAMTGQPGVEEVLRAKRIELVDDKGVVRVRLGQDAPDAGRRSRAAGIAIFDNKGIERGGFSTFDDDSVVLAMDAPKGVGDPMPDRIGLRVYPNGAADIMLIDNQTRGVVKLFSDGAGGGGPQLFKWDMDAKKIHVKTLTYDGEKTETYDMGH